ncbi:MAG: hypothetical protein K2X46_08010, partial [Roseomonas sp.]|nr:hypothetical protein [Roseomonas sp.]
YRPRVLIAETVGLGPSLADRAAWEVRHAAGRGTRIAYTLPGWRGSAGRLWRINTKARVIDSFIGIDEELLVCGVVFSLTENGGSQTQIEVTLPDAYDVLPEPLKSPGPTSLAAGSVTVQEAPGSQRYRPATQAELDELQRPRSPGSTTAGR